MNLLRKNKGLKFTLGLFFLILICISIFVLSKKKETSISIAELSPDLFDHPIYSNYEFSHNDSVINIGIQPLYLPTGIIFEVLKRDNILNKALLASGKKINYYPFLKGSYSAADLA
jgi:hypothetical protein